MESTSSEVGDDPGSGWFQVKKKHRTTSKSSIRGFVGEFSRKVPSSFLQIQSSVDERSGKSCNRQRSHSEARKDFTRNMLVAHGECSSPDSKAGEKVMSSLDKCITNQDAKPSKSSSAGSISVVDYNDKVQNVQVVSVEKNMGAIPKIKWGDLDVDTVLYTENLERVEMVFGNLGDEKLVGHNKLRNAQEFVPQYSFCNERHEEKEAIVLADGGHSPAGASSVTLTTECCKELNEISSEYVKLLDEDDKRANLNDSSIHKFNSEHIESVNNLLRDCVNSSNPGNINSLSEGTGTMISPQGHDKSDDGAVDIPEVPVEEGISSSVLDNQDSVFPPVIKSGPEASSDDLAANVEDFLHGEEAKVEFSKAHIANALEEGEYSESKERFRQRLWCFLFENLNRAVDELYLLCELECDLDQMKEAILVLEEAASDFKELISRVEGFENVKGSFSQQSIDGLSMNAKGDHCRPHALSWEVRRMTASPHRAEILSSSLEAFKKIQNERTRIHPVHGKKILDPAFANNLSNNISGMSGGKDVVETKTAKSLMKSEQCRVSDLGQVSLIKEKQDMEGSLSSKTYLVKFGSCDSDAYRVPLRNHPAVFVAEKCTMESLGLASESEKPMTMKKDNVLTEIKAEKNIKGIDHQRRKIASDKEKDKEKRNTVSWKSMDAWKEKRNWEDVLSSPLRPSSRVSHSPGIMRRSVERARVLHDKLMSPEKKKKTALDLKKEAEEKHARAMRMRIELENERVQRLQRTSEKLNRVNEWQAVRNMKLREGMHARHQRSESRHEAYLAEVVRRAGDESSKVNEVRFITSLNEENKKLMLRQKLHDSELRRAEKIQMIKSKQKEDMAREEAALERRRLLQAERLRRLAETQRKKEEAQVRREEERKASSAAREAKAMEQVRRQEFRARAQQEEAELLAQKLAERLSESEQRRKIYLEQIRERASMDFRDQSSPSIRRSLNKDSLCRSSSVGNVEDCQANNNSVIGASASRISDNAPKQPLKRRIKKIRQRLMALKYEFPELSVSVEGAGIGYRSMVGTARAKIGRWIQELQRLRQARKEGATSIALIIGDMIKFLEGKEPELHASRQAGLLDFIASALPASHTSRPETCQVIIYLVRLLRIVLSLPANRSYFLSQNLLPPIIPMLSAALENYIKIAASVNAPGSINSLSSKMSVENFESVSEVLEGFLWIVTSVMGHASIDERQLLMQEGLLELVLAYQVIHRLRDLFALHDRPQAEGSHFPSCIILSLNLLAVLTSRPKTVSAIGWGVFPSEELSANATQESEVVESVDLENSSFNTNDGDYVNKDEPLSDVPEDRPLDESCRTSRTRDSPSSGFPQKNTADIVELKCVSSSLQMHATEASCTTQNSMTEWPLKSYLHRKDVKGSIDIDAGQTNDKIEQPKEPMAFLLSVIVETSLVSLPSLLTAVLLQANSRSSSEQGSYILPSNFEEVATGVLKVLNNLALLDLILLQRMLGRPDLKMEFFHLMSFLLSHCSSKWKVATDQVGQLLLESLLLLGYFALFHPGNQAVLRWGKSPTILHKVCDLPFVLFSNPELMPILAGTIVAACYGCEQNRDVVQHELSKEMVLSLLGSCRSRLGPTESNPSIQDDPTMMLEPNLLGLEPKKSQVDMSGRCNRHNVRNTRSSLAKLGPTGSSTRGSKIRNQRDNRATKGWEISQNLPGLGSSSTPMLHSRIPSSVIDKLEEFFSTSIVGATKA